MKPVVAITLGDHNGIGPEVTLKSISMAALRRQCRPLLVGPPEIILHSARSIGLRLDLSIYRGLNMPEPSARPGKGLPVECVPIVGMARISFGAVSAGAGRIAVDAIRRSVELLEGGEAEALVTAPLSKSAVHKAGFSFPGQTELLLRLTRSRRVAMMMVSKAIVVGLVTIHEPLKRVASLLSEQRLRETITIVRDSLRSDFSIPFPRLAVLGLNPHAGEDGGIGTEERTYLGRAIRSLRRSGFLLDGPLPADGFFARYRPGCYDAVVAMYHDQGLVPFKILARNRGVNFSAGLRFIRTSPAHGTAFDIAGRGKADPSSMAEAIRLATRLARARQDEKEETR